MGAWKCPRCGREFKRVEQPHYCGKPTTVEEYIAAQRFLFLLDLGARYGKPRIDGGAGGESSEVLLHLAHARTRMGHEGDDDLARQVPALLQEGADDLGLRSPPDGTAQKDVVIGGHVDDLA